MNVLKKIVCIVLCMMMFQITTFASKVEPDDYAEYKSAEKVLSALGITNDIHFDSQAENFVTRYEFAQLITRILNVDVSSYKSSIQVSDVSKTQYPTIAYLMDVGIMNGTGTGVFSPDEYITVHQVLVTVLRVLGYDVVAELQGGEDAFYSSVATKINLTSGLKYHKDDRIQYKYLTQILYNALHTEMYVQSVYGDKNKFQTSSNTLLYDKFEIKYTEGRINANDTSAITGKPTAYGYVKIDNINYNSGESGAENFLGYYVMAYYKEINSSNRDLLFVNELEFNSTVEFDSTALTYNDYYYTEYQQDGKTKKYKLSNDFVLIVNGVFTTYSDIAMLPTQGYIKLVNIDSDSQYETVIIRNERLEVVHSNNSAEELIAFKYDGGTLELSKWEPECIHIYDADGEPAELSSIREWSVLNIMENTEHITIYITNDNISGSVVEINNEGDMTKVKIGDDVYEVSPLFKGGINNIKLNDTGKFYKDVNGRIAVFRQDTSIWNYAFLLDAKKTDGINDVYEFKMFSSQNPDECIVMTAADKIYINGNKCSSLGISSTNGSDLIASIASSPKLIRYQSNAKGLISKIETEGDGRFVMIDRESSAMDTNKFSTALRYKDSTFAQRYAFDGNTVIFVANATEDGYIDFNDEEAFEIVDTSYFLIAQNYQIICYMENPLTDIGADVIIVKKHEPINSSNGVHGLVMNIISALNDEDEVVQCIEVFKADGTVEKVYGDTIDYFSSIGIEENDIVMYRARNGKVFAIDHMYDYDEQSVVAINYLVSPSLWYGSHILTDAPIENIQGTLIQFSPANKFPLAIAEASKASIAICDNTSGRKAIYSVGKLSDIKDIVNYGVSSKCITYINDNLIRNIFIYIE